MPTLVRLFVLALLAPPTIALGCATLPRVAPPTPGATCFHACSVLRRLDCPEAATTSGGYTCEDVCEHVQATGYMSLNVECIAAQDSVEAVRACGVRCMEERP